MVKHNLKNSPAVAAAKANVLLIMHVIMNLKNITLFG